MTATRTRTPVAPVAVATNRHTTEQMRDEKEKTEDSKQVTE
jgi:hypothetical protein